MGLFKKKEKEKTAEEWFILGIEEDNSNKQLEYYTKALEMDPEVAIRWVIKGEALNNLGRYDEAIICLDKALEFDPELGSSWNFKGVALKNLGRYDEAMICFDKALKIDPDYENAQNNKEMLNRDLKKESRNEDTIGNNDTALEINQHENNNYNDFLQNINTELFEEGMNLLEGDPIEAINVFEKRINEYPNDSSTWYFMGKAYDIIGDRIKSLECYDRAIELEPRNDLAWRQKGFIHLSNENPHKALECFNKIIELHEDAEACYFKGIILASFEEHKEAVNFLSDALEVEYNCIQDWHYAAWYQKGVSLYILTEYEEAITCSDEAIEIDPNVEDAWRLKGKSFFELGKIDEADKCLDIINKIRDPKPEFNDEGGTNEETIRKQISTLKSEINGHTKDRAKKYSDAGELAYSECIENAPELSPDAKNKLDDILAIDTLISRTNQEMEKTKGGQKKSEFLGKLGDAVTSTAKQGKLKVELYNLERKKNSAITDFGEALWESHKSGDDALQELSDIWQAIDDIEQQIHKNEEEIDNLNELLG